MTTFNKEILNPILEKTNALIKELESKKNNLDEQIILDNLNTYQFRIINAQTIEDVDNALTQLCLKVVDVIDFKSDLYQKRVSVITEQTDEIIEKYKQS